MITLEMAVHDALHRIKNAYEKTNGKIYLSFSGGKDSTIVAELIKMAELPEKIPFVFADTGIEFDAIKRFVKDYEYENIQIVKPEKTMQKILKEYGYPVLSKNKSELLSTFQRSGANSTARARQLVYGFRENGGIQTTEQTNVRLANKHMHLIHPDHEYKIANKCCYYMKKRPFLAFAKENAMIGAFTGVRIAEGGARAVKYTSCTMKIGKQIITMPIIDWTDEICDEFIEKYNVKLSDVYTVYGLKRSGCIGCPYGRNIRQELESLQQYEPLKYKATMHFFKKVYLDLGVELPTDATYTKEL
ncbi:MAG: phosphoadenosine phosphosulfate reductase family protein, partial [Culicoidibacterales bacterium]